MKLSTMEKAIIRQAIRKALQIGRGIVTAARAAIEAAGIRWRREHEIFLATL